MSKWIAVLIFLSSGLVEAETPRVIGLSGAGNGGLPNEALFTNPASLTYLKATKAFVSYTRPKIDDLGGGRVVSLGFYDATSNLFKGALGYVRESQAEVFRGSGSYNDSHTIRLSVGSQVWRALSAGLEINYGIRKQAGLENRNYFYGKLGLTYPIFKDLMVGATLNNALDHELERPRSLTLGARYDVTGPIALFGDMERILGGDFSGENSWAMGLELTAFTEVVARVSMFQDGFEGIRGSAYGISWNGPRTAFEYTFKRTSQQPQRRDHVFGIAVQL